MIVPIVIKVGTGVLTRENGTLDGSSLVKLVTAVAALQASGQPCILVSSGAVGAGVSALGLTSYPEDVEGRQAAAAVGQARLMRKYETLFQDFDLHAAQLLLTGSDLEGNRHRVLATLERLLSHGSIVPIINENDSVAVDEVRVGDNDILSARVAKLVGANKLILFTTVDGLLNGEGSLIPEVPEVGAVLHLARDESGKFSIGGMASKLQAVALATQNGIEVMIANGRNPEQLSQLVSGSGVGTRFLSQSQ
ncbi:glutamate 5-kinase [Akkermansiaceae bacterium]|jgi:glutamate 5-kinase|nr:glutamate 5-kinase [Akkermansiaceae bacterium]